MAKYRKLPVVIDAVQWSGNVFDEVTDWISAALSTGVGEVGGIFRLGDEIHVFTIEGTMKAQPGDYILRGIKGEIYPCKPDIFKNTYEKVAE